MRPGDLHRLEDELRHTFVRRKLLMQAVTHRSLASEQKDLRSEEHDESRPEECGMELSEQPGPLADNEQLELLGDAVVGLLVTEALFMRYPELAEGDLTRMKATLVSRRHMGQVALSLELGRYLRLGRGEERSGARKRSVLLANTLEAVIAALYLDAGLESARKFVLRTIVDPYAAELRRELGQGDSMGDHKSALQQLVQARREATPEYHVMAESGPDHRKRFLVEVTVHSVAEGAELKAQGSGSTKKKAEQEAARLLHDRLRKSAQHQLHPTQQGGKA